MHAVEECAPGVVGVVGCLFVGVFVCGECLCVRERKYSGGCGDRVCVVGGGVMIVCCVLCICYYTREEG